ncbi:MAG: HPF/RaiA family ribosome-associated protein [Planctomycetota bacterium]|jgi:hypothetical protein
MQIDVTTDHTVEGSESFTAYVVDVVSAALRKFDRRITRLKVHLGDENGHKPGRDTKRCTMEVRVKGRRPTAATYHADTVPKAVDGAALKMRHALEHTFGKLEQRR